MTRLYTQVPLGVENKSERWNYFKGDYDNMKNELNQDWDNLLNQKSTSQQLKIFMNIINEAKKKLYHGLILKQNLRRRNTNLSH